MKKYIAHSFSFLFLLATAFLVSYLIYGWFGYPRGSDANVHIYQVQLIKQFWPNIWWTHTWAGGMALFTWYPVFLPYLFLAFISNTFGVTAQFVLNLATVVAAGIITWGIYLIIYRLTKNFLLSIFLSISFIATPTIWGWTLDSGLHERFYAFAPFCLATWAYVSYFLAEEKRRLYLFLSVVFICLTIFTQALLGFNLILFLVFLSFILLPNIKKLFPKVLKVILPSLLLASFVLFPIIMNGFPGFSFSPPEKLIRDQMVVSLSHIFFLVNQTNRTSSNYPYLWILQPILVGLFLTSLALFIIWLFRKKREEKVYLRFVSVFLLVAISLLIYSMEVFSPFSSLYGGIWLPKWALPFFTFFAILATAVMLFLVLKNKKILLGTLSVLGILATFAWLFVQFPNSYPRKPYQRTDEPPGAMREVQVDSNNAFRFGTGNYAGIAGWFNVLFPNTPQTRDHCANCITDPDSYFYLQQAAWKWKDNIDESLFLFDWWAVDKFVVKNVDEDEKFHAPNIPVKLLSQDGEMSVFEYLDPTPIIDGADSPSILVITKGRFQYDLFFRSLAQLNLNTSRFIPVNGGPDLDQYSLEELRKFDVIVVYEPDFESIQKASSLLRKYLESGGKLYVEGGSSEYIEEFLDFLPISKVVGGEVSGTWSLDESDNPDAEKIIKDVKIEEFSPPEVDGKPWGIQVATAVNQARPIILEKGNSVIVVGEYGNGKVVWSGFNLFYHIDTYKNQEEARLLGNLLSWLIGDFSEAQQSFDVQFVNPQERRVVFKGSGREKVLFKEFYTSNWEARLKQGNKTASVKIYKVGPGFMGAFLPSVEPGSVLVFRYHLGIVEKLAGFVSILTLLCLILYLFDWWIFKPVVTSVRNKLMSPFRTVSRWWRSDEE